VQQAQHPERRLALLAGGRQVGPQSTEGFGAGHGAQAPGHLQPDLPAGGRPVTLVWFKRVWRCAEEECGRRTWSERHQAIRPRAVLTERARAECARRVGEDATDVARVAVDLGVGWATVMRAVWEYGQRILDQQWLHTNVTVLGLDETAFLAATAVSTTQFVTGLVRRGHHRGAGSLPRL